MHKSHFMDAFSGSKYAQQLYGFSDTTAEKRFRTLLKVNGVGPKMALGFIDLKHYLNVHS